MITIPAVFCTVTIIHYTIISWITKRFKHVFCQIDGIVQIIIIHIATVNMDLAPEFLAQLIPVTFHDVGQIKIFFPKLCNVAIYIPRLFVPNAFWISIGANR